MAQSKPLPRQELGVRGVSATEVPLLIVRMHSVLTVCVLQGSPKLTDFVRLKTIGTGTFGTVLLVQHKRSAKYYALKALEKARVCKTLVVFDAQCCHFCIDHGLQTMPPCYTREGNFNGARLYVCGENVPYLQGG